MASTASRTVLRAAERAAADVYRTKLGIKTPSLSTAVADLSGGNFADILLDDPDHCALVLIDARRYSRHTQQLAAAARTRGMPVTLITDPYCDWGRNLTSEMFAVPTDLNHFWDATSPMASLIGQLINGVFRQLGAETETRMAQVSALYGDFVGHTGDARHARPTNR